MYRSPRRIRTEVDQLRTAVFNLVEQLARHDRDAAFVELAMLEGALEASGYETAWLAAAWRLVHPGLPCAGDQPPSGAAACRPMAWGGALHDTLEEGIVLHGVLLRRLVAQAARQPRFLASVFLSPAQARHWNEAVLAKEVGCPPAAVGRLLLCQRPRPNRWATDVAALAAYGGVSETQLAARLAAARFTSPTEESDDHLPHPL